MLKPSAKTMRHLEKSILYDELVNQESHKEEIKNKPLVPLLWDRPFNHGFIYTIYDEEMYLTYVRYSIMSLRLVHHYNNSKIMVFVEGKLWEKAKKELKGLLFDHDIVRVEGKAACYKQVIACHPLIKDFEFCTFVDADLFFLGKQNSMNKPLTEVKNLLLNNPTSFVWAFSRKETPDVSHTFLHKRGREGTLRPHTYTWDLEEELEIDVEDLIHTENTWNISFIFSFCPKRLQTDEYKAWALYSMLDNNMCDESIWWLWSKKHNCKAYYWGNPGIPDLSISTTTHESKEKLHLFQPMFTDTLTKKIHRRYETFMAILEIENNYRDFITIQAQNLNVDWWEAPPHAVENN